MRVLKQEKYLFWGIAVFLAVEISCSGPEVIKLLSFSTQLSMQFQLLIQTKIQTNEEVSSFKSLRCCIYHANKC